MSAQFDKKLWTKCCKDHGVDFAAKTDQKYPAILADYRKFTKSDVYKQIKQNKDRKEKDQESSEKLLKAFLEQKERQKTYFKEKALTEMGWGT